MYITWHSYHFYLYLKIIYFILVDIIEEGRAILEVIVISFSMLNSF